MQHVKVMLKSLANSLVDAMPWGLRRSILQHLIQREGEDDVFVELATRIGFSAGCVDGSCGWIEGDKSSFASKKHGVPGNIVEFAEFGFVAATINYRMSKEAPLVTDVNEMPGVPRSRTMGSTVVLMSALRSLIDVPERSTSVFAPFVLLDPPCS